MNWDIRLLETPAEMEQVETLQRTVWPGSETDVVPAHLLITFCHNGGLVIGAWDGDTLAGATFGFVGLDFTPDGPRPKHCSHQTGVLPAYRSSGVGFALKRAQWQMIRHQGIDRITWTYDPLLSLNANLNIARLGAVCNTYRRNEYGEMRDGLNVGLPSDRFQVDWWLFTARVEKRMSQKASAPFDVSHFEQAHTPTLYPVTSDSRGLAIPPGNFSPPAGPLALAEIPSDFLALKDADFGLAAAWRELTRAAFEDTFRRGYIVTDFVYDRASHRSFYVLTDGERRLPI